MMQSSQVLGMTLDSKWILLERLAALTNVLCIVWNALLFQTNCTGTIRSNQQHHFICWRGSWWIFVVRWEWCFGRGWIYLCSQSSWYSIEDHRNKLFILCFWKKELSQTTTEIIWETISWGLMAAFIGHCIMPNVLWSTTLIRIKSYWFGVDLEYYHSKWACIVLPPDGVIYCISSVANRIVSICPWGKFKAIMKKNVEEHPQE